MNEQLISFIGKFLLKLGRSFISLLSTIFIDIPLRLLRLIFPPPRHNSLQITRDKAENLEKAISAMSALQEATQVCNDCLHKTRENRAEYWEKAIIASENALQVFTAGNFPELLVSAKYSLAFAYQYRIIGDKAENLEKAIACYQKALQVYTFDAFPEVWAETQRNLGDAYYAQRIRGDRAKNLEDAIVCYQKALQVYTFDVFPKDWAVTQNNLALAYTNRIRGDKAESLEDAIACYHKALQVYTFDAFPWDWADTQHNLALAYEQRIRGDKAKNLENAIACCQKALQIYTFEAFPEDWAYTQLTLGTAYAQEIRENQAENLETAIACYRKALKVWTFDTFTEQWANTKISLAHAYSRRIKGNIADNLETAINCCQEVIKIINFRTFPQEWAATKHNLGDAYLKRIRGDKADNLEIAIKCYQEALKVTTFNSFPKEWAETQNNPAIAYYHKIRGDKAENLEHAIKCYQEALRVRTIDAFPWDWAGTQHNLVNAYSERIRGDKAENLECAIDCCQQALKVYTFDSFPVDWAKAKAALAYIYLDRIRGDKADNLEYAIDCCQEALKVYTFELFPIDWAGTQHNLANAYLYRIRGDKPENLQYAISAYENALTIYTIKALPEKCLGTAQSLGYLGDKNQNWQIAIKGFALAVEAAETLRSEALTGDRKQEILSQAIQVYHGIVHTYINLYHQENNPQHLKTALEYIERSKARNLVELMTQKNLKPQGVNQATIDTLDELRQRVVNEQIRLQNQGIKQNISSNNNLMPYVRNYSHLKEYQQALDEFIKEKITPFDPTFNLTQKVQSIPFSNIQALTDAETCLVQWYITNEKILAFVVSSDGGIKLWESSETDLQELINVTNNYLQLYYSQTGKQQWITQLPNLLQTFADTLHINDILALIPNTCKRLILVPHRYLHIIPLHALPVANSHLFKGGWGESDLHDLFPNGVQYAPSCQLLQIAQRFHHSNFNKLFAIQNPTKDLIFTDLEVNILSTFFTESEIISKDEATKTAVIPHLKPSNNHCHHFSCHGGFNPNNPLESALLLANQEPLTLGEIFELNLNQSRLVVLSACETGLIDLQSLSDEYIGLPSGFLFAGSSTVVSSLWTVSDLSTAFLMMRLYENIFDTTKQVSVGVALKEAQNWLQNLTVKEFEENLAKPTFQQVLNHLKQTLSAGDFFELEDTIINTQNNLKKMSPEDKPFKHPFYWAAFIATGV